jgi:hypothetical protein
VAASKEAGEDFPTGALGLPTVTFGAYVHLSNLALNFQLYQFGVKIC